MEHTGDGTLVARPRQRGPGRRAGGVRRLSRSHFSRRSARRGQTRTASRAAPSRSSGRAEHDGVAPRVQLDQLGQHLVAQPAPGAGGPVDAQAGRAGHRATSAGNVASSEPTSRAVPSGWAQAPRPGDQPGQLAQPAGRVSAPAASRPHLGGHRGQPVAARARTGRPTRRRGRRCSGRSRRTGHDPSSSDSSAPAPSRAPRPRRARHSTTVSDGTSRGCTHEPWNPPTSSGAARAPARAPWRRRPRARPRPTCTLRNDPVGRGRRGEGEQAGAGLVGGAVGAVPVDAPQHHGGEVGERLGVRQQGRAAAVPVDGLGGPRRDRQTGSAGHQLEIARDCPDDEAGAASCCTHRMPGSSVRRWPGARPRRPQGRSRGADDVHLAGPAARGPPRRHRRAPGAGRRRAERCPWRWPARPRRR